MGHCIEAKMPPKTSSGKAQTLQSEIKMISSDYQYIWTGHFLQTGKDMLPTFLACQSLKTFSRSGGIGLSLQLFISV